MPAPSQLAIATSSLQRLFKEQASYHKELASQRERLAKLESSTAEDEMGNRDFEIKQQRQALEETQKIFPTLQERITTTRSNLQSLLDSHKGSEDVDVAKAKEALKESA